MFELIKNVVLLRTFRMRKAGRRFLGSLEAEFTEEFLELLLKLMGLVILVDKKFRRNIKGFKARYLFKSQDRAITVAAIFQDGRLRVSEEEISRPDITVQFKNSRALMNYLLSPKPDIIGSMLRQDVVLDGNLNYLYKFAYMANQLKVRAQELI